MHLTGEEWKRMLLKSFPTATVVSGGSEVLMRCLNCPDSRDPNHAHMYFKIPTSASDALEFCCVKCGYSGHVTPTKLMSWNIYDPDILIAVAEHNKNPNIRKTLANNAAVYRLRIPVPQPTELNLRKLKYINDRLDINLTLEDTVKERIIISLEEFLNYNRITKYTRHVNIMNQLEANFVGFLSYDCAFINLRNCGFMEVYKTINDRYVNYNIFGKKENTMKFYVRPVQLNTLNHIRVNIAEGPFDILSVQHNLTHSTADLNIAVTGSGYMSILRFIFVVLKLIDIEIHIYKDNDMSWRVMDRIADFLAPFMVEFYVHYNNAPGEKDMGVPKYRIQESVQRLL